MPVCGRLGSWSISTTAIGLRFVAIPHLDARPPVDFASVLRRLLPTWNIKAGNDGYLVGEMRGTGDQQREQAEAVLFLLKTSVTIEDRADASHALRVHDAKDNETDRWQRSDIGRLVWQAKSYDQKWGDGDRRIATQLVNEMLHWIEAMPPYAAADVIVPAPASNLDKTYDLPAFIAGQLSSWMRRPLIRIHSSNTVPQKKQKNLPESEKLTADELARHYVIGEDVRGRTALVIDDIYESGATVEAMTKVLRNAGARAVLSLTATKTAKGCQGLTPTTDHWPLEA